MTGPYTVIIRSEKHTLEIPHTNKRAAIADAKRQTLHGEDGWRVDVTDGDGELVAQFLAKRLTSGRLIARPLPL